MRFIGGPPPWNFPYAVDRVRVRTRGLQYFAASIAVEMIRELQRVRQTFLNCCVKMEKHYETSLLIKIPQCFAQRQGKPIRREAL